MTFVKTDLEKLIKVRIKLIEMLKESITNDQIKLFISFYELNPNWDLITFKNIEKFPGIKWKITNLKKISKTKRKKELNDVISYFA